MSEPAPVPSPAVPEPVRPSSAHPAGLAPQPSAAQPSVAQPPAAQPSAGGLTVRLARSADGAALGALDRRAWSRLHSVQPRPTPPYAPFFDAQHPPAQHLVAEVDGRVAGYIRLLPPTPLAANAHVRQIQGLAVDEWARGRGVGRGLLHAACAEARRQGAVRLTLRVLGHNTPARRLYEAAGFAVEGVLAGEFLLEGAYVDDVLMGRSL
ncbi:GNAT family N-acetyltransferase [Streptomyces zagrosensis]|uniref:Ribosomal protein S18 acetylase RimI-like enzyme n=1 Tax=Streptomyces zagrosensis TaxID=1042984 RepID=A0A7W9Q4I7_9ACTN|nr:GNAT family N-acetyltransferase [Streptomyces zagrosensis]MBB5933385.1 ribosomal protein S18 acetylase RimI-like enzyme [Streptomyces zagrosensis]